MYRSPLRDVPHRYVPLRDVPHRYVPFGHVPHGDIPFGDVCGMEGRERGRVSSIEERHVVAWLP